MKRTAWMVGALVLPTVLLAGTATALELNDRIFVRTREARLLKSAAANAKPVRALKQGEALTWLGRAKKDPRYHQVQTARGEKGVVFYSQLATTPPRKELSGDTGAVPAEAHASFGAAARGVTEGPKKVSERLDNGESARQLDALIAVSNKVRKELGGSQR
ncbi:MAG: hypothetical protein WBV82_25810 [Myxococcaceae bacterium]